MLVELTQGKYFGTFATKFPPNHYQYKAHTVRRVKREGIEYELDLSDIVDWHIFWGFKEKARESLFKLLNLGDTVIDVGANVGAVALKSALLVGPNGQVHAFEPDPTNYNRLMKNFTMNSPQNLHVHNLGLGESEGYFLLETIDTYNRGKNKIVEEFPDYYIKDHTYTKVKVVPFDTHLQTSDIDKVNLIKIDVEGYEFHVIKGAIKTLEHFRPKLFIEIDEQNLMEQGSHPSELVHLLEDFGYKIFHAESDDRIERNYNFKNCHFDIYALPSS